MDDRERDLADVAALADGSLPAARRADVERRVAASPELTVMLARQRRAVDAVRAAAEPAPASLRARLERKRAPRRRLGAAMALAGAAAAAAAAAVLAFALLPGGGEAPSVAQAAALAPRGPTGAPPARFYDAPLLYQQVGGIFFPRWEERFGWRASGVREDRLRGRRAATVYYTRAGRRIGYTIVDGSALPLPSRGERITRRGTKLVAFPLRDRTIVTWHRRGHTCVLSGAGVPRRAMLELAAWRAGGGVAY